MYEVYCGKTRNAAAAFDTWSYEAAVEVAEDMVAYGEPAVSIFEDGMLVWCSADGEEVRS